MSFGGIPVPQDLESSRGETTYQSNATSRTKIYTILIIIVIALLLISVLIGIIIAVKKKQTIVSHVTSVTDTSSTIITAVVATTKSSSSTKATTTVVNLINDMTTFSADSEPNSTAFQLPSIPKYNTNKTIAAGSEVRGSNVDELNNPIAIALDSKSNLFIADAGNFRVAKYIPNSKTGEIILGHGTNWFPKASTIRHQVYIYYQTVFIPDYFATLALDSNNGDLYVVMYGYDRVTKFTLNF